MPQVEQVDLVMEYIAPLNSKHFESGLTLVLYLFKQWPHKTFLECQLSQMDLASFKYSCSLWWDSYDARHNNQCPTDKPKSDSHAMITSLAVMHESDLVSAFN